MQRFPWWIPIALAVLVVGSGAARVEAAHVKNVSERVFAFEPGGSVAIESQNGRIIVEAWNRPEVRIQITREARANDEKKAQALLRELSADVAVSPERIEVLSNFPKRRDVVGFWDLVHHGVQGTNIHYYLQVPRETSLELKTSNGEIRVRGAEGSLAGTTTNGSVEVTSLRGSIEVGTTNGAIRLSGIDGTAAATTTNGSVSAEIFSLPPRGRLELMTTNGNVRVALPKVVRANLDANTTNGRVRVSYPFETRGTVTSKSVQGTIGGGGARLRLQTTNGNIDVAPGGSAR